MGNSLDFFLPTGCKSVLCAVSGGADSVCMLHALKADGTVRVCCAHFEHGIRGEESKNDARFVKELCEKWDIPFLMGSGDVPQYAKEHRLGIEEAARVLRYEFLENARRTMGCDHIATAHNADDNAETMLFNLARGTGAKGLCGIPQVRGKIIRPMLKISRAEIEDYLRKNGIDHVEDSTNGLDEYSRNIIRHRIMPVLGEINPGFVSSMSKTAELLRRDEDYFRKQTDEFLKKNYDGESVPAAELSRLHPAVSSRVIRALTDPSLSSVHVDAVLALTESRGLAFADIPGKRIRHEQGRIYFSAPASVSIAERELVIGKSVSVPEIGAIIVSEITVYGRDVHDSLTTFCLKYENICHNVTVSGKKDGDSFAPLKRGCTKTLKSLFTEKKMTQRERDSTLVFRDGKGIAAVSGFGVDRRFKCGAGDKILKIEIIYQGDNKQHGTGY
ncbi:MAG: tRNA lysidine(34) synthetase TilS [Eubacteriales bacterium]|nr:tRNA lysidine(34) synthetase TilS [Eubacteriales bacterium]